MMSVTRMIMKGMMRMQIYSKTMMIRILSQELDKQWSIGVETVVRLKRKYFLIECAHLFKLIFSFVVGQLSNRI